MPFEVQRLPPATVIVAWEIEVPERHEAFRAYMEERLDAAELCESVYTFNSKSSGLPWDVVFEEMEALIDLEEDVIYVWDMAVPRGELGRQLFMTKIG